MQKQASPREAQLREAGTEQRVCVSVVSPVYNEEATIDKFHDRLAQAVAPLADKYEFEFVLVDDGSIDRSLVIMRQLAERDHRIKIVELRRNVGQTGALQAGLDLAKGEIVITLDSDLQHFPEEIPAFLNKLSEGWDVVCGWRHVRREGVVRRWPSSAANALLRWISGLQIHDIGTTFRAYRREILDDIRLFGENHRFIPILASVAGARITELPIENIARQEGKSNYGLGRTVNVLFDMFFLYFFVRYLDRPIRVFGWLSALLVLSGLLISAVLLLIWLATGAPVVKDHSGWFVLGMVLMLSGLQTILAGVVMEMIIRVYFQAKTRGPYYVRKVWSADAKSDL